MASASNNASGESSSKGKDNDDIPCKEPIQENDKPHVSTDFQHSSESLIAETQSDANEQAEFSKSNQDDSESTYGTAKNFHNAIDILKGILADNNFSPENGSTLKDSNSVVPEDNETIQSSVMQKNGSPKAIQLDVSEEDASTKAIQLDVSEENGSFKAIQLDNSEEDGFSKAIQLDNSEEDGSTKAIQLDVSEKDVSTKAIQLDVSEKDVSTKAIQLDNSEEDGSSNAIQLDNSEKDGSTKVIKSDISEKTKLVKINQSNDPNVIHPLDSIAKIAATNSKKDASVFSSGTAKISVASNDANPSEVLKAPTEKITGGIVALSKNEKNSDTSETAKGTDNFKYLQDSEYRNGSHFVIVNQRGSAGGYVMATPSPPCTPIFPDFEIPPVSLPTTNTSVESLNPSNPSDDIISKDISSTNSLSALVSILVNWVNQGLDRAFNKPRMASIADFINYAEKELKYELDILKRMKWRVDTLMKATHRLPDPDSVKPSGTKVKKNLIRDDVVEAGMKVWRRLEAMEADAREDYERFVLVCRKDSAVDKQLEIMAINIISNSYVKVSENFSVLNLDIEIFRYKIREFCSELDRFL